MSFGGSVHAMITSLKNNKRGRLSVFDRKENILGKTKKLKYLEIKFSSEEFEVFKKRLVLQRRKRQKTFIIGFIISLFLLISFLSLLF